jgi:hypothetical protein
MEGNLTDAPSVPELFGPSKGRAGQKVPRSIADVFGLTQKLRQGPTPRDSAHPVTPFDAL